MTSNAGAHRLTPSGKRWRRRSWVISALIGTMLSGGVTFAASNWIAGLAAGSSGEAQSGSVTNLTITAIAAPAASNLLFPGATGDVVISIGNTNAFPVTITAVNLPTSTTYAAGYTTSALGTPQAGCSAATSQVGWNFATAVSGSSHTLTTPLTVGASSTLVATLTNDATMGTTAPSACQGTYFSMPSFTGVTATAGSATATTSPATDAWTS